LHHDDDNDHIAMKAENDDRVVLVCVIERENSSVNIRVRQSDLEGEDCSGEKLREILSQQFHKEVATDIEIYDNLLDEYVSLDSSESDVLQRFNSRLLRVRIQQSRAPAPLAITGRYYSFQSPFCIGDKQLIIHEWTNQSNMGTGANVWDGAILLARYLHHIQLDHKRVLELGAGCGLVGLTASLLGAESVVLTDLPHIVPLLQCNVNSNRLSNVECVACDWYQPKQLGTFDVILVADCVWMEDLVTPLLSTLKRMTTKSTIVYITYQRRGKGTHLAFWKGLHETFDVHDVDTSAVGLEKPSNLYFFQCQRK